MKQKLGLCCALIHDPDLLILMNRPPGRSAVKAPVLGIDPRACASAAQR